jgi:hypothetical protein
MSRERRGSHESELPWSRLRKLGQSRREKKEKEEYHGRSAIAEVEMKDFLEYLNRPSARTMAQEKLMKEVKVKRDMQRSTVSPGSFVEKKSQKRQSLGMLKACWR